MDANYTGPLIAKSRQYPHSENKLKCFSYMKEFLTGVREQSAVIFARN